MNKKYVTFLFFYMLTFQTAESSEEFNYEFLSQCSAQSVSLPADRSICTLHSLSGHPAPYFWSSMLFFFGSYCYIYNIPNQFTILKKHRKVPITELFDTNRICLHIKSRCVEILSKRAEKDVVFAEILRLKPNIVDLFLRFSYGKIDGCPIDCYGFKTFWKSILHNSSMSIEFLFRSTSRWPLDCMMTKEQYEVFIERQYNLIIDIFFKDDFQAAKERLAAQQEASEEKAKEDGRQSVMEQVRVVEERARGLLEKNEELTEEKNEQARILGGLRGALEIKSAQLLAEIQRIRELEDLLRQCSPRQGRTVNPDIA